MATVSELADQMWSALMATTITGKQYNGRGQPDSGQWGAAKGLRDQIKAAEQPAPTPTPTPASPKFGISTGAGPDTVTAYTTAQRASYFDKCLELGAPAVRIDDYGDPINVTVAKEARAKGLDVLVCVGGSRRGFDTAGYQAFATACAQRHAPLGITEFELMNEPNIAGITPASYGAMAKAGASAVRGVVQNATIVAGGLSNYGVYSNTGAGAWNPVFYLEQMLAAVGVGWFDAVSIHPYGVTAAGDLSNMSGWGQIAAQNPSLVSTLAKYGSQAKVWVTEHGAQTTGNGWAGGVSEDAGAKFMIASAQAFKTASWAGKLFVYTLLDRPSEVAYWTGHLGLLHADWTAKPGFAAFKAAIG